MRTVNLKVSYFNGQTTITDIFPSQGVGTVKGTITAGGGYNITRVQSAYYKKGALRTSLSKFVATKISDTQYSYSFNLTYSNISDLRSLNTPIHLDVTVAAAQAVEPSLDLNVAYKNGLTDIIDQFRGQKAGTVTGTVTAGTGFVITELTGAYYKKHHLRTDLTNFVATKISNYKYSYSFSLTNSNISDLSTSGSTVNLSVETKKEPGNINVDSSSLVNCSIYPSSIIQGQKTVLTLNADSGYILNSTGAYTVDGTTNHFTCNNVSSYQLTILANRSISVSFTASKIEETKPSSIIHTYVLNQDNYNNLGKQIIDAINTTGTGFEQYDYTKFVQFLYEIPFDIGTNITTNSSTINLGKHNLKISCKSVTHETLNINLGTIDLTGVSSSHDFNPFNITLFCPFSSNIDLPATVIGSKLYLSFSINLKTEQGLLLVKQNDNIIYSGQTELFTDLPLYYTAGLQDTLIRQLRAQYQNTIKQAYIVVNYHKPITGLTSYRTTEHGTLSEYKGFTRVSHGTLKRSISSSIDNALLSLLRQGVIIK